MCFKILRISLVLGGLRVQYMSEWLSFLSVLQSFIDKLLDSYSFTEQVHNKYPTLQVDYSK